MTFIYAVKNAKMEVYPTDDTMKDSISVCFDGSVYLSGFTVADAEKLADLLLQAAMAMRLAGRV